MWKIQYLEQESSRQPAEEFEDGIPAKLAGKLAKFAQAVQQYGFGLGGGIFEKCHGYSDLYEIRAKLGKDLGREFCTVDGDQLILLCGIVKGVDEATPVAALQEAAGYLCEYQATHRVSPEEPEGMER